MHNAYYAGLITPALAPHAGDAYALCMYWRITHSASFQNAHEKPMKFQDDYRNHIHYIRIYFILMHHND